MKQKHVFLVFLCALAALIIASPDAVAYERYRSTSGTSCVTCHGDFTGGTSPKGSEFPVHGRGLQPLPHDGRRF